MELHYNPSHPSHLLTVVAVVGAIIGAAIGCLPRSKFRHASITIWATAPILLTVSKAASSIITAVQLGAIFPLIFDVLAIAILLLWVPATLIPYNLVLWIGNRYRASSLQ